MLSAEEGVPIKTVKSFLSKSVSNSISLQNKLIFKKDSLRLHWTRFGELAFAGFVHGLSFYSSPNFELECGHCWFGRCPPFGPFVGIEWICFPNWWPHFDRKKWWDLLSFPDTIFLALKLLGTRKYGIWFGKWTNKFRVKMEIQRFICAKEQCKTKHIWNWRILRQKIWQNYKKCSAENGNSFLCKPRPNISKNEMVNNDN